MVESHTTNVIPETVKLSPAPQAPASYDELMPPTVPYPGFHFDRRFCSVFNPLHVDADAALSGLHGALCRHQTGCPGSLVRPGHYGKANLKTFCQTSYCTLLITKKVGPLSLSIQGD